MEGKKQQRRGARSMCETACVGVRQGQASRLQASRLQAARPSGPSVLARGLSAGGCRLLLLQGVCASACVRQRVCVRLAGIDTCSGVSWPL